MSDSQALTEPRRQLPRRADVQALLAHPESRHAVKYGIVGVTNVVIDSVAYALLVWFGVWYVAAKILSFVLAMLNGYTFNRRWTFRAGRHRHEMLVRYATVQCAGLALNLAILATLVEVVGLGPIVAQGIALPFVAVFGFVSNRLWTFGRHLPSRA